MKVNFNKDETPLTFGKYKGLTPNQIAKTDPSYIVFMWDKFSDPPCTKALALECEYQVQEARDEIGEETWSDENRELRDEFHGSRG